MTAGLLSFGRTVSSSPFVLNIVYESSALAAPQSFRDGVDAAVVILQAAIRDPITVNVQVGYGTVLDGSVPALVGTGAAEGFTEAELETYVNARSALQAKAAADSNSDLVSAAGNLPAGTTIFGSNSGFISRATCKALSIGPGVTARDDTRDGYVGFGTNINLNSLVGVALHELTHALGRVPDDYAPFAFNRFTAVGTRTKSSDLGVTAWLSIDNGTTHLVDLDVNADTGDNADGSDDVFSAHYSSGAPFTQNLSALDKRIIGLLGFKVI